MARPWSRLDIVADLGPEPCSPLSRADFPRYKKASDFSMCISVYCAFRVQQLMQKGKSSVGHWIMRRPWKC